MLSLTDLTTLTFSGAKAQEFLQGQLTCDMRPLSTHGANSFAAVCDHRGRMLANFWVVNWHNDFLFVLPKSVAHIVADHLKKYAVFSKVMISHENRFFITETTETHTPTAEKITIALPNPNRFLTLTSTAAPAHTPTFRQQNIADHLALLCDKTSLLFTPQMIDLEKNGGVSFTKGCYVGQEIVARTHYLGKLKRHLHRLQLHSDQLLTPGDEIENGVIVDAVLIAENTYDVLAVTSD